MKKSTYKKAFTLIETLIVIAIIGILSSIVLFSLTPSRNKAKDTKIIAHLNELRSILGSYYDPISGIYDLSAFNNDTSTIKLKEEIRSLSGGDLSSSTCDGDKRIAFWASLPAQGGYYCVDTLGNDSVTSSISDNIRNNCSCR